MFSFEFCESFKNTFVYRTHPLAASVIEAKPTPNNVKKAPSYVKSQGIYLA